MPWVPVDGELWHGITSAKPIQSSCGAPHVAYWCSNPIAHSCQASKSSAAGKATSGHGVASALSRDAFVGGFD
jgi:hypothetical protein